MESSYAVAWEHLSLIHIYRLDESIISFVRKEFNLVIGQKTAKLLKETIGSALPGREDSMVIVGRDVVSGPVSYTHLDVYQRQWQRSLFILHVSGRICCQLIVNRKSHGG